MWCFSVLHQEYFQTDLPFPQKISSNITPVVLETILTKSSPPEPLPCMCGDIVLLAYTQKFPPAFFFFLLFSILLSFSFFFLLLLEAQSVEILT